MKICLIGCGALAELYYGPALLGLRESSDLTVVALVDPDSGRRSRLSGLFPGARAFAGLADLKAGEIDLAIVASPPRFHAEQTGTLFALGAHVLCEKPMATSISEARGMVEAARRARRLFSVGLFRRFFPSSGLIKDLIINQNLGAPRSFEWSEGGTFGWPAVSSSFFQKTASGGGVFADLGAHVIDLLLWWFGNPDNAIYEDDAMGGLEANASLKLHFPGDISGRLRLSRDTNFPNGTRVYFERGSVWFRGASADEVVIQFNGCASVGKCRLHLPARMRLGGAGEPAQTYSQSFMAQITCFADSIRRGTPLLVTAEEALAGQELIERCYASRGDMRLPWLGDAEQLGLARRIDPARHEPAPNQ